MLMSAYSSIAGEQAIPILKRVLSPGVLGQLKNTESQIAAVIALESIGTESSQEVIQRSARSLNSRVREACKRALSREGGQEAGYEPTADLSYTPGSGTADLPVPVPAAEDPDVLERETSIAIKKKPPGSGPG
jgi:HEAT repeat protein